VVAFLIASPAAIGAADAALASDATLAAIKIVAVAFRTMFDMWFLHFRGFAHSPS
jgi:hypothetical protein